MPPDGGGVFACRENQHLNKQERKTSFLEKLLISKRNRKRESAVKGVANGVHTAKLTTESHLRRRAEEKATGTDSCRCVIVQKYSLQTSFFGKTVNF